MKNNQKCFSRKISHKAVSVEVCYADTSDPGLASSGPQLRLLRSLNPAVSVGVCGTGRGWWDQDRNVAPWQTARRQTCPVLAFFQGTSENPGGCRTASRRYRWPCFLYSASQPASAAKPLQAWTSQHGGSGPTCPRSRGRQGTSPPALPAEGLGPEAPGRFPWCLASQFQDSSPDLSSSPVHTQPFYPQLLHCLHPGLQTSLFWTHLSFWLTPFGIRTLTILRLPRTSSSVTHHPSVSTTHLGSPLPSGPGSE